MTDLTDRIAAHPATKAAYELGQTVGESNGEPSMDTSISTAEAALVAAMDAEDQQRADLIAELRGIATDLEDDRASLRIVRRLEALIARLEGN